MDIIGKSGTSLQPESLVWFRLSSLIDYEHTDSLQSLVRDV
jgi:hypothetical protein